MKKILVNLYLSYIRFFAKQKLGLMKPLIIGIGGASGKSSLAAFVASVLNQKYKIKTSQGKNSETGIPLDILGIGIKDYSLLSWFKIALLIPFKFLPGSLKFDIYIAEMGIDSPNPPKNMEYLLRILRPSIAVVTNISIEHSLYFDPLVKIGDEKVRKKEILDLIAREEGLLLKSLSESGKAIVNLDDKYIKNLLPLGSKSITVSAKDKSSDFYIYDIFQDLGIFKVKFLFLKENYEITINQPLPRYFAATLILAIAVCFACGISVKNSIKLLEKNFSLPPGRFSVFAGIRNSIIIDSSYNSSLESAAGAIAAIKDISGKRRKVGVLGDMRELGSLSKIQHEKLSEAVLKNMDFSIIIGPLMTKYVAPVLGKHNFKHLAFDNYRLAENEIIKSIQEEDIVLVKGSQNTLFLERAVELLLDNKRDSAKLCRRGKFWDKKRNEA